MEDGDHFAAVADMSAVAPAPAALEAHDLYRFYHAGDDETLALRGVSLRAEPGELVAVSGPSGSGKSTLLACLAGLDEPDGGTVLLAGRRLSRRSESERAAMRAETIGMLFQSSNLLEQLTVVDNIRLAQRVAGRRRGAADPVELLEILGIADRARAHPSELSGGELACAGLAVALANRPTVLLADEPTGELDRANGRRLLAVLRERAVAGMAVVVVTHSPAISGEADHLIEMHDGAVSA